MAHVIIHASRYGTHSIKNNNPYLNIKIEEILNLLLIVLEPHYKLSRRAMHPNFRSASRPMTVQILKFIDTMSRTVFLIILIFLLHFQNLNCPLHLIRNVCHTKHFGFHKNRVDITFYKCHTFVIHIKLFWFDRVRDSVELAN